MSDLATSLKKCRVEGNTLFLPPISEGALPNYPQVKTALLNAGAKYKKNSFVFSSDAQPFIDRLLGGESVNIRKEFQFFPTPSDIADWLVGLADIKIGESMLEPSAGQGAIIDAIRKVSQGYVWYCELMPENAAILAQKANQGFICADFLEIPDGSNFDKIVANPPFSKNQDIDHIYKMYEVLNEGGRIVSVASKHWQISDNTKETYFREWLKSVNAEIHDIEAGRFKESGTMVSCCVIVIDK